MALPSLIPPANGERSDGVRFSRSGLIGPRRILVVAPQPFYEDRGTPIALRQVLQAASELGYRVDLLTFPVGSDVDLPGLTTIRAGNPLGVRSVPVGLSLRKGPVTRRQYSLPISPASANAAALSRSTTTWARPS